ncbi:hypothetical protein L6164_027392 [Bauhinia variegata]|uniref:Uncharacterized protein n=1 Tax=Bauhinia variegata TaxID=167791 RepID=A0ACB9LTG9_BAUVA|nr:hypothetical protein L6164_027392 [Bauhinia variegata]
MTLETLPSNEFFNFIIYETISATPFSSHESSEQEASSLIENRVKHQEPDPASNISTRKRQAFEPEAIGRSQNSAVQGRKKRKRKPKICKNKEEAETQRMTHITVERNRRKQMNEHLAVLRSLMPESYVQRGDQASIVGGAIDFMKELEHRLQSLEAQKFQLLQGRMALIHEDKCMKPPFSQFFVYPQFTWSQVPNKHTAKTKAAIADTEVTLIETHANLRIMSRRTPRQLTKLVAGFQALYLTILHLNVTAMGPFVLYSVNAKVEEGCQLGSVNDIATAVHHLLSRIEEEASLLCC